MVAGEKPIFAGGGVTARYDFACNGLPVLIQLRIIKNSNTAARIAPKIATVRHKTERRAQLGLFMQFSSNGWYLNLGYPVASAMGELVVSHSPNLGHDNRSEEHT